MSGGDAFDGDEGEDDVPTAVPGGGERWVDCSLAQILATDPPDATYVVVLREDGGGGRAFPIHIGPAEWQAIHRPIHGLGTPRPMTHDLLASCLAALDARLLEVRVCDLVEDEEGNGTFYGALLLERDGVVVEVDSRPSDALAMAMRLGCGIKVAEHVLARLGGGSQPE